MSKYVLWIADGGIFTEERNPPVSDGDIKSIILNQIGKTYALLKETYPQIKTPTSKDIENALDEGENEEDLFKRWTPAVATEALAIYDRQEAERVMENMKLLAHIKETIATLNKEGVINLVIGFRDPNFTRQVLEKEGIENLYVIETETKGLRFPNEEVWDKLIVQAFPDIKKENVLLVGKESVEMVFAKSMGIPCIWIRSSAGDRRRCASLGPMKTVYNTEQCLQFIKEHFLSIENQAKDTSKDSVTPTLR